MLYTSNSYVEGLQQAGTVELSEISGAISSCRAEARSEDDLAVLRTMIRFFNDQALAAGYSDLN